MPKKRWSDRVDFVEVYNHSSVLDIFRDRLEQHGYTVSPHRRNENDGRGSLFITAKNGGSTVVPYHLPEDLERLERLARQVITSEGANYRGPSRLER